LKADQSNKRILDMISHRIHGAAIYGAPWIPSVYPFYVSINIPAPAGSVMALDIPTTMKIAQDGCEDVDRHDGSDMIHKDIEALSKRHGTLIDKSELRGNHKTI
jgi:hypothetical protein